MKLLIECCQVPENSTVSKSTGQKTYILKNSIKVYGSPEHAQEIKGENVRFLVATDGVGGVSAIDTSTVVAWHCDIHQLYRWVIDKLSDVPK